MTDQELDLRLKARVVTIETNLKFFELNSGMSSGTTLGVTFDIPEGMDRPLLKRRMLEEKEQLAHIAAIMELSTGNLNRNRFDNWVKNLKRFFDELLKRGKNDTDKAGSGSNQAGTAEPS